MASHTQTLVKDVAVLGKDAALLWGNQKNLAHSAELLDEQFAVATRLSISWLNKVLPEKITEKDVETLFLDWAKFRARDDFKDLMMEWFMGKAIDELLPVKKEEPAPTPVEPVVEASPSEAASA